MKAQSKEKKIIKPLISLNKPNQHNKQTNSLLGKKLKAPITERQNKFKSSEKLNKSNLSEKKIFKKNKILNQSISSAKLSNKSLSINSKKSDTNRKQTEKKNINLNRANISRNKNKISNLNKGKFGLSKLQSVNPINRNINKNTKAYTKQAKNNLVSDESTLINNHIENASTPVKNRKANLGDSSIGKKNHITNSSKKSKNKISEKKGILEEAEIEDNINKIHFDANKSLNLNVLNNSKDNSSKKSLRVSFLDYSADKYIFKSSGKKSLNKTPQKNDNKSSIGKKSFAKNSSYNRNKDSIDAYDYDNDDVENYLKSKSAKKSDLNKSLSGKKSKTKSFISNLSKEKTLTKSDKKSIKSIKDSVKKINFDDEDMEKIEIENETKSLNFSSLKRKRNIEHSRSRSVSKSKEKNANRGKENINKVADFKAKKINSNVLNANIKKNSLNKYNKIESKVGLLFKGKNQDENKKTLLKNFKTDKKNDSLPLKRSSSVPIKDKKEEVLNRNFNNNIISKFKKFKAESSLKKLFSENPLLKANKNKVINKQKIQEEKSPEKLEEEIKQYDGDDEVKLKESNEEKSVFEKKIKSSSQKKPKRSNSSAKKEDFPIKEEIIIPKSPKKQRKIESEENRNLINSMKSIKKESSTFKDNYMGKGKEGLDDLMELELIDQEQFLSDDPLAQLNKNNIPTFSEGYLYEKFISENKNYEDSNLTNQINNYNPKLKINSEEIFKTINQEEDSKVINSEWKDKNNDYNEIMKGFSPTKKAITNKLSTALKSSYKKNNPLNTELKLLSKEFRYLLSGKLDKAKQTQEILQEKIMAKNQENQIEKKLNFFQSESNQLNQIENSQKNENNSNNEEASEYENMNDDDIANLENDILQKVLEENFGFKNFLTGQLQTIKNILNYKATLTVLPPSSGKSLCYQLPSLVLDGLTIVVCPLLASITDQLTNLPGCLSGASLTTFTNQHQRSEIMSAIALKKIKILFITPERLALENFSEIDQIDISLICFDDAICCSPLSQNFRSSYISILTLLNSRLKPNSLLLLANNTTNLVEQSLMNLFKIPKENVVKKKLSFPFNYKISVSKDENKLSNLVKMLRNSNLKSSGTILIFCNLRKQVDKVTSFLNQNGLSASAYHAGKSEIERQMIQNNFLNDKIKILVATVGFCNGIAKGDIRCVIMFDMPASVDMFYQLLSRGGRDRREAFIHVFLNDEDYFIQRNMIYFDNVDKDNIKKFVESLFALCASKHFKNFPSKIENTLTIEININNENNNSNLNTSSKINDIENKQSENITNLIDNNNNNIFNVVNDNDNTNQIVFDGSSNIINNNEAHIKEDLQTIKDYNMKSRKSFDLPKRISFNFNKICEQTGIKKNMQIFLLLSLLNDRKINSSEPVELSQGKLKAECFGIGPTHIHLRFFKKSPWDLAAEEPNLQVILESSRELVGGIFKFSTGEVCQKLGITYVDLINYLYCFQNQDEIGYETKDEGMFINIERIPENLNEIVDYLYNQHKYLVNLNIKKLNASYSLFRKYAAASADCFSFNKAEKSGSIRCLSIYNDYRSYEEAFKKNFDLYFEIDENLCDFLIAGNENELAVLLPIVSIESQREKANIQKNIEEFARKEFEKNQYINSIDLINVLFGINIENKSLYLSNPLWGKYQQYDYNDLLEIIESTLIKIKSEYANKNLLGANQDQGFKSNINHSHICDEILSLIFSKIAYELPN